MRSILKATDLRTDTQSEKTQHNLLEAIESANLAEVHLVIGSIQNGAKKKAILTSPSTRTEHRLRTPLQAAAMSKDMSIYGAVLGALDSLFPRNANGTSKERKKEMMRQLEVVDGADMNLLMHSAAGGNSAIFKAVAQEIQPSQVRRLLHDQDEKGMTFIMHAVNAQSDEMMTTPPSTETNPPRQGEGGPEGTTHEVHTPSAQNTPAPSQSARSEQQEDPTLPQPNPDQQQQQANGGEEDSAEATTNRRRSGNLEQLDPWVPVISSVLEFAKKKMWMADYRKLLETRDAWGRSIVEHAVASGRRQVFETVFNAIRDDIYDEKMIYMFDTGVDSSEAQTTLSVALQSSGGKTIQPLVAEKTKSLEKDVSLRAKASTVAAKIQTFIPANLIVIFQLLLPEFDEESNGPLYLLIALCVIAPFWSWGSQMASTKDPEHKNTSARQTPARHFLAIPATFFWGTGTSKIGTYSFNWEDSVSAAALAVATILIPALDSFFSGRGARETNAAITCAILDLRDWSKRVFSPRDDEPDPYPGIQQQQQQQQQHQEKNDDQEVEESKGEGKNEQLLVETKRGGHQGDVSTVNMSTASSARRSRLATNSSNNAPRHRGRAPSSDEMEAGGMNPTGRQDTPRSRNPQVAITPGSSASSNLWTSPII